ncbi:pyrroline-5-carboxylate reductase [Ensifer canadensis]
MTSIILVGAGSMGFAMLQMWTANAVRSITVIEPNEDMRMRAGELGADTYGSPHEMPGNLKADVVVIATKPRFVAEIVSNCSSLIFKDGFVMSVAAGVTLDEMAQNVKEPLPLIRCMPNTPAAIGEGMIVCCANRHFKESHRVVTLPLLSQLGLVSFVDDEALMNAVTAVSGSGPAYLFHFIEALQKAGVDAGLSDEFALMLAKQTVFGAAKLAQSSHEEPAALIKNVTSPNGTTAAGMAALKIGPKTLLHIVSDAVAAASERAAELCTSPGKG